MSFETIGDTLLGGANDDTLVGDDGSDVIAGGAGDDVLVGDLDKDYILGGAGDDIIVGGQYTATNPYPDALTPVLADDESSKDDGDQLILTEDTGIDIAYLLRPDPVGLAETLMGGAGDDVIVGGIWADLDEDGVVDGAAEDGELWHEDFSLEYQPGFANIIWAGVGDDIVYGANGFDTIGGGDGADFLYGFDGPDIIYGGAGDDFIYGGDGDPQYFHQFTGQGNTITESLYGGAGDDHIWGEGGADMIWGGDGADDLYGGAEDDTISGGAGADIIHGGEGDDVLTGGEGADAFTFSAKDGTDVITDFNVAEDSLYFADLTNQMLVDEQVAHAVETTQDGQNGLLLTIAGNISVFLVGLDSDDISSIIAHAGPIITVDL